MADSAGFEEKLKALRANFRSSAKPNDTAAATQPPSAMRSMASTGSLGGGGGGEGNQKFSEMRQRHQDCIRMLQEKVNETKEEEEEMKEKLQKEMQDLNKRLEVKEHSDKTLEVMKEEQLKKVDQMKHEMTENLSKELEKMRDTSLQDLHSLKQSVEEHMLSMGNAQMDKHNQEVEAQIQRMQQELQEALQGQRKADLEASELRVRLASTEERAKMLQDRQEELRRDRQAFDEERREMRQQSEQQWQKLMSTEKELECCKKEAEVQRHELARLVQAHADDEGVARSDRENARAQEAAMQQEIVKLRGQVEEAKRDAEMQALKSQSEGREAASGLRLQVNQLEAELASRQAQLNEARQTCNKLDSEKMESVQREEELRKNAAEEVRRLQEEIEDARAREGELMEMLTSIQETIIAEHAPGM